MSARSGRREGAATDRRDVEPLRDRRPRQFAFGDETLTVRVRESTRARTSRIIVGPRRPLEVIVATGTSDAAVDILLEAKRAWVERKVVSARAIAARPAQLGLDRTGVVWIDGEAVPVIRDRQLRPFAELRDGRRLIVGGDDDAATEALVRWYRREARWRIVATVARETERLGLDYRALAIRDQRTRWGSCSSKGNLSFSWRLLVAPGGVRDYVIVHELCHLREPSHSKLFWRLLGAVRPGWREEARWLREHGQELHDYDPGIALA